MNTFMFSKITFNYDSSHVQPIEVSSDGLYDSLYLYIPYRYNTQPTFYYILFMFGYYLSCKTHFLEYGIALSFTLLHVFHIHCNIWLSLLSFHLENKFFSHTLQLHGHSLAACYTTQSLFNFLLVIKRFSHTL